LITKLQDERLGGLKKAVNGRKKRMKKSLIFCGQRAEIGIHWIPENRLPVAARASIPASVGRLFLPSMKNHPVAYSEQRRPAKEGDACSPKASQPLWILSREEQERAENLVFNLSDWAEEANLELFDVFVSAHEGDGVPAEAFAQALATREQFKAIASQQRLKVAGAAVRAANRQLCSITAQLAQDIGLGAGAMDRALFQMALLNKVEWALEILLDRSPQLAIKRIGEEKPGHWPLTMLAGSWSVDAMALLIQRGAGWSDEGKKVLTGIAWNHPRHPAQAMGYSSSERPWWADFFNDERYWGVFSTNAVQEEFDSQWSGPVAELMLRDPESADALRLVQMLARGMSEQVAWGREADITDANAERNQKPSREALIAEIYLSKKSIGQMPQSAQGVYAAFAALGLAPTESEQEAIWALRARFGLPLADLPAAWTPNVGEGSALWALLAQSRRVVPKDGSPGEWNAAGGWIEKEAAAVLALAKNQGRNPVEEWLEAAAARLADEARQEREEAAPRSSSMLQKLDATLNGFLALIDKFPDFAPKAPALWRKKIAQSAQIAIKKDLPERRRSEEEAAVLQHEILLERTLSEWERAIAARAINGQTAPIAPAGASSKKPLRL